MGAWCVVRKKSHTTYHHDVDEHDNEGRKYPQARPLVAGWGEGEGGVCPAAATRLFLPSLPAG